jgi:bifunctional oligoribonuclease and PAP phosphatase NrnA
MTPLAAWQTIDSAQRILMTTHVRPDGDGLGSLAALAEALGRRGKDVRVVLPSPVPAKYAFLHGIEAFEILGEDIALEAIPGDRDLMVIVDTCSWPQLDNLRPVVEANAGRILVIDHHVTGDDLDHVEFSDPTAAATGEILIRLLDAGDVEMTPTMAESLFVSVASDTGWFQFPNVTPNVFRLAARLQELGARPQPIYEHLFQGESWAKMQLLAEVLSTMALNGEGDVATMVVPRDVFDRTGAKSWDTENIINESQRMGGVVVSILCVEQEPGTIKVSLRSKHDVDVSAIARQFGGGGHARASGCTMETTVDEARRAALEAVLESMGRPVG